MNSAVHALRVGIVLPEMRDEGLLAAFLAGRKNKGRSDLIRELRDEIQNYLDAAVAFGEFSWV